MPDESDDVASDQVGEMHHHAEGHTGWVKFAALTAALLAALAAISGSLADVRLTESSRARKSSPMTSGDSIKRSRSKVTLRKWRFGFLL